MFSVDGSSVQRTRPDESVKIRLYSRTIKSVISAILKLVIQLLFILLPQPASMALLQHKAWEKSHDQQDGTGISFTTDHPFP